MTVLDHPTRRSKREPRAGRVLLELDPRELLDNPLNPRADVSDVSAEAASMRECGVLEPLIVVPVQVDGAERHMILFGHRRRAAAIEAGLGTVPCDVRPEYADRAPEQLADMLVENLHRRELSGVEEAGGYAQLSMFDGWTPERIARRLGRPAERVRAGLAASEVGERLRPRVVDGSVTLEQAAAIEEFGGDEKAYARLLRVAEYPPGLHHAIAEERHRRLRPAAARRGGRQGRRCRARRRGPGGRRRPGGGRRRRPARRADPGARRSRVGARAVGLPPGGPTASRLVSREEFHG